MDRRGFLKKSAVVAGCTLVPTVAVAKVSSELLEDEGKEHKIYSHLDFKKSYWEEDRCDILQSALRRAILDFKEYDAKLDTVEVFEKNGKININFVGITTSKDLKKAEAKQRKRHPELYKNIKG